MDHGETLGPDQVQQPPDVAGLLGHGDADGRAGRVGAGVVHVHDDQGGLPSEAHPAGEADPGVEGGGVRQLAPAMSGPAAHHRAAEARRAPSTREESLAHTMEAGTFRPQAEVPKPQSVPATTRSRPTISA